MVGFYGDDDYSGEDDKVGARVTQDIAIGFTVDDQAGIVGGGLSGGRQFGLSGGPQLRHHGLVILRLSMRSP